MNLCVVHAFSRLFSCTPHCRNYIARFFPFLATTPRLVCFPLCTPWHSVKLLPTHSSAEGHKRTHHTAHQPIANLLHNTTDEASIGETHPKPTTFIISICIPVSLTGPFVILIFFVWQCGGAAGHLSRGNVNGREMHHANHNIFVHSSAPIYIL